jgi:hypothetical protein
MKISELVNVSIGLSVTPPSQASFNVPLLLVDHADVPIDTRYLEVTRSSYATDLTAATEQVNWCAALWAQNYNPASAYIGRWVSADSSPYFVCVGFETTVATWEAVVDGCFTVTTTAGADILAAVDFTGVTSLADIALVIDGDLVAGGLSGARCTVDALNRIIFTDGGVTGAGADTVVLSASGAGTALEAAAFLNAADGFQVGGVDIEAQGTAMNAILAKDNAPFIMCERGGSIAQVLAFSVAVNALDKILLVVDDDPNAKNSALSTDVGYQIHALTHNKTHMTYTEHTTTVGASANQYPDAATIGEILSRANKEGAISLALNPLTGVSQSGLYTDLTTVIPLTVTERSALEAKGYDYLIKPNTVTHLRHGLAAGGNEMRVMIGKAFMAAKISEEIYGYLVANEVVTFSDPDIQALKGITSYWANEMVDRGLLDADTFEWDFPSAADFTAATKATHTMTLSNVFSADVLSAVNDIVMTMSFSV